jgi:alpha-L-fucosidase
MGLGYLAPTLIANYYNKSLKWNRGKMDVVVNLKGVGGRYNSFQNNPELLPYVDRSLVKSTEAIIEPEIMAYPFQTETSIADWHYKTGQKYLDAPAVVRLLMENVCRNGTMLLNLTQHGRGDVDPEVVQIAKNVGAWLRINGDAVYGSRPFEVYGEANVRYTRNRGHVYATLFDWPDEQVTLKALRSGGPTIGKVKKVELLGDDSPLEFVQNDGGLTIIPVDSLTRPSSIRSQTLSSAVHVLRITHDKNWTNDDDVEAVAHGWLRRCNLGSGDYNNDLTFSDIPGAIWSCDFSSRSISIVAPKEAGAGTIEIEIDGQVRATADLSTPGTRRAQQTVSEITNLGPGKHSLAIINKGPGPVSFDALILH